MARSEATGPNSSGSARSTPTSARQSPPKATRDGQVRHGFAGIVRRP